MGPLPRRQLPYWLQGNENVLIPTRSTASEKDQLTIRELLRSRRVHQNELLSYRTPDLLLNQDGRIIAVNERIIDIINDMARARRIILLNKVNKKKSDIAESERAAKDLILWPAEVQELQGQIVELEGRYVRIPPILVTDVKPLS